MYLFLDDERRPGQVNWDAEFPQIPICRWHVVRDIDQFKAFIDEHLHEITHIAFDHDLAFHHYPGCGDVTDDGRTGYDCAKYLVDQCMERNISLPKFSCHSMNPAGRQNILAYLNNYKRHSGQA
jgi:hypothetical protein